MEDIYEWKGLNGQLVTFKKEVDDAKKITYIGSPGVCTPFAEFLTNVVRDRENHFIPLLDIGDCHRFEARPYAMVLTDDVSDPYGSDVVVLLGGLSMPKYDVDTDKLNALVDEILAEDGKVIGVCFMDMFVKAGWPEKVNFDLIIDGTLTGVVKK